MGIGRNGNDFTGMGGNGNSKSHFRTPLVFCRRYWNTN